MSSVLVRSRYRRPFAARGAVTALTAAAALLSGCSGAGSTTAASTNPSVTFDAQAGATPGFTGDPASGHATPSPGTGGTSAETGAPVGGTAVGIDNFMFAPATVTIPAGSTVTWTNHDAEPHTVVASDNSFHSPGLDTGATFSHAFTTPGSFDYICSVHPFMHATVVVTK